MSFIDLHNHPSLKAYGKSFKLNTTKGQNSHNPSDEYSIWHQQLPKKFRRVLNVLFSLTKWRQSDFTSATDSSSKVVIVSLYPLEKGMVKDSFDRDVLVEGKIFRNLATGISMKRIRHLQKMKDYYTDLYNEYLYFKNYHSRWVDVNGILKKYVLVKSADEIDYDAENTIHVILSIEGAHVFNCGLQSEGKVADETEVLEKVYQVKNWDFPPFFIGLAHHFDNELCGFSKSFSGLIAKIMTQNADPDQGLTELGINVLDRLLDKSTGKRILIDLKHMNPKSRYAYYDYLKRKYPDENIPLIVSHGAINGKLHPFTHNYVMRKGFNVADINFFFDEILKIEASKGIFGIQLDERRIYNPKQKKKIYKEAKTNMTKFGKESQRKNTYYIWRQIQFIATYLDSSNRKAWDIQALGTDFDGIINPLNGIWTVNELQHIDKYLYHHAKDFLSTNRGKALKPKNKLSAEEIVEKFMIGNAKAFIERNF